MDMRSVGNQTRSSYGYPKRLSHDLLETADVYKSVNRHSIGTLRVADLARQANVTPATVRYYSRVGLLNPAREADNGYRQFATSDVQRLAFVRRAQTLGLTIGDIKSILETIDQGGRVRDQIRSLVEHRLQSLRDRLGQLRALEARIHQALDTWAVMQDAQPKKGELCPMIERLRTV